MKKILLAIKNLCDQHSIESPIQLGLVEKADKIDKTIKRVCNPSESKKTDSTKINQENWFE